MLFRPSFCAHCGERIERAEWYPWTSRRFCLVCESQYKGQDLIPRAVILLGVLMGIFGIGSYLKSGSAPHLTARTQPQRFVERQNTEPPITASRSQIPQANAAAKIPEVPSQSEAIAAPVAPAAPAYQLPPAVPKADRVEVVHYCSAETKKGTPCARRVKGNVRCYQHAGMPAMQVASEKPSK